MSQFSCPNCGALRGSGHSHTPPDDCCNVLKSKNDALEEQNGALKELLLQIKNTLTSAGTPDFDDELNLNDIPARLYQFMTEHGLWKQDRDAVMEKIARLQEKIARLQKENAMLQEDQAKAA